MLGFMIFGLRLTFYLPLKGRKHVLTELLRYVFNIYKLFKCFQPPYYNCYILRTKVRGIYTRIKVNNTGLKYGLKIIILL